VQFVIGAGSGATALRQLNASFTAGQSAADEPERT